MSFLKKLFGGGSGAAEAEVEAAESVGYKGYQIHPNPIKEGGVFRVAARIEKEIDGETQTHQLIRSDTVSGLEAAVDASVGKAKLAIDQLGDQIFR